MKIYKIVLMIGMLSLVVSEASALSIKNYKYAKSNDTERLKNHLNGVEQGMSWSNTMSDEKLYCSPKKMTLNISNIVSIIDKEIKLGNYKESVPVEFILIKGLIKTFPCK